MEGEGKKLKGFIKERRKGIVSWIRFGEEGLRTLPKQVETICKEGNKLKRLIEWKEKGRSYRLENRENELGSFLMCSITEGEGKRYKLFIPEGRGFLKGWTLLVEKLRAIWVREKLEVREEKNIACNSRGRVNKGYSFAEAMKKCSKATGNVAWVDVGDCVSRG